MEVKLLRMLWRYKMICPACNSKNEMAYSSISNGFICLEPNCGLEIEMGLSDAQLLIECAEPVEELVYV